MNKSIWIGLSATACLLGSQAVTAQDSTATEPVQNETGAAQLTLDDLRTFADVFNQVRRNYIEEVDDRTLLDAAIRGMLSELDPHSAYLPGKDYSQLNNLSRGKVSGIGTELVVRDGQIVVRSIIDDSPADKAGIEPGDIVVAVDGDPVKGRYLPDVMDEISGTAGTEVRLKVRSPGGDQPRGVTIERKEMKFPSLGFRLLDKGYGYYRITAFHRESAIDLEQSLDSVKQEGTELNGLVIDLRNNGGGVMQPAIAIADGFLEEGLIVSTRGRNAATQLEFEAHPGEWLPGVPLLILVDSDSASAAEVLAAAVQDHQRGVIVGERTFGKGSVQSVLPLRNGSGIKLTTARYYTPNGRSIQAEGVQPDVVLDIDGDSGFADRREIDLDRHLNNDTQGQSDTTSPNSLAEADFVNEILDVLRAADLLNDAAAES